MNERVRNTSPTVVDSELLAAVRKIAEAEGRDVQSLVDEALADILEKKNKTKPRDHVMAAYQHSRELYGDVYKKLAE